MSTTVQRWLHLEDDVLGIAGHRDRLVRRGPAPGGVVITAPHAVPHVRDGVLKRADMWTGGLALLVAELTGVATLVETSGAGDPSWQREHPFKDALAELAPAIILDLHAMRGTDQVVEVGSGAAAHEPVTELAVAARDALERSGIPTLLDHRFPARGATTVVQWARSRGAEAVQLEVSVRLVPPFASEAAAERLVAALCDVVEACRDRLPP